MDNNPIPDEPEEEASETSNTINFSDLNFKTQWAASEKDQIGISAIFLKNSLVYGFEVDEERTEDNLEVQNDGVSFNWNRKQSEALDLSFQWYVSDYQSDFSLEEGPVNDTFDFRLSTTNAIQDLGISGHLNYRFNKNHSLLTGYNYGKLEVAYTINELDDGAIDANEAEDSVLNSHALFSEYLYSKNKTKARLGVRAFYLTENSDLYLEPRFRLETPVTANLLWKMTGEIKHQAISQLIFLDLNDIGVGNNIWVLVNNTDIPVLKSQQVTGGLLYEQAGWSIDMDTYYRFTEGVTTFSRGFNFAGADLDDYLEGNRTTYGMDLFVKKRIRNFRAWLGYSLSKSDLKFQDLGDAAFPANFDQRHSLSLASTWQLNNIQLSLGWQFITGKPFTDANGIASLENEEGDEEFEIVYDALNAQRLDNYHRLDFSAVYDFSLNQKGLRGRVGVSVQNIYNRNNEIDKRFRLGDNPNDPDGNPFLEEETRVGLGITPNVVARIFF